MITSQIIWNSSKVLPPPGEYVLIMLEYPNKKFNGCTVGYYQYYDTTGWYDFLRNSTPLGDFHSPAHISDQFIVGWAKLPKYSDCIKNL